MHATMDGPVRLSREGGASDHSLRRSSTGGLLDHGRVPIAYRQRHPRQEVRALPSPVAPAPAPAASGSWWPDALRASAGDAVVIRPIIDGHQVIAVLAADGPHRLGFWLSPQRSGRWLPLLHGLDPFDSSTPAVPVRWAEGWRPLLEWLGDRAIVADHWTHALPLFAAVLRQLDSGHHGATSQRFLERPQVDIQTTATALAADGRLAPGEHGLGDLAAQVDTQGWARHASAFEHGRLDPWVRLQAAQLVWQRLLVPRLQAVRQELARPLAAPPSEPPKASLAATVPPVAELLEGRIGGLALWFPADESQPVISRPFRDLLVTCDHDPRRTRIYTLPRRGPSIELTIDARNLHRFADLLTVPLRDQQVHRPSDSRAVRITASLGVPGAELWALDHGRVLAALRAGAGTAAAAADIGWQAELFEAVAAGIARRARRAPALPSGLRERDERSAALVVTPEELPVVFALVRRLGTAVGPIAIADAPLRPGLRGLRVEGSGSAAIAGLVSASIPAVAERLLAGTSRQRRAGMAQALEAAVQAQLDLVAISPGVGRIPSRSVEAMREDETDEPGQPGPVLRLRTIAAQDDSGVELLLPLTSHAPARLRARILALSGGHARPCYDE